MEVKHIGIFGKTNVGKSSFINFLLEQEVSIVSDIAGTTTDPVKKRMEILGVGPVQLIDTAGFNDNGEIGDKRVEKTLKIIKEIDLAILIFVENIFSKEEKDILSLLKKYNVPTILLHNKSDEHALDYSLSADLNTLYKCDVIEFSCNNKAKDQKDLLVSFIVKAFSTLTKQKSILDGLVNENDNIVLVCPIDSEAPQGRLILPQVMAIRDILDKKGIATVLQLSQLQQYIKSSNHQIKLVVTDSQVFKEVNNILPDNIPLTSFSVLMARSKGPFTTYIKGAEKISALKGGDKVLIMESCSHHSSCDDIGRVKIPMMLNRFVNRLSGRKDGFAEEEKVNVTFVSGLGELPKNLKDYALAIQCGGCMVTHKQLNNRVNEVVDAGVEVTNYGMAIAYMSGIFERALKGLE